MNRQYECNNITIYDAGTVSVKVGTVTYSASYDQSSSTSTIASALASAINGDTNALVTATPSGATITLVAKAAGSYTDYLLSASSATSLSNYFSAPSFGASPSGSSLGD